MKNLIKLWLFVIAAVLLCSSTRAQYLTGLAKDINPGAGDSNPFSLANFNGTLFFGADDGTHGGELWKSDGTPAGTAMVKDINPGAGSSNPGYLTDVNG